MALLALAPSGTTRAADAVLRLGDSRLTAAGIGFTPATAPDAAAGSTIALTGRVTVPNNGLEVVLAQIDGRIESLLVNPGQTVRAGQPLVRVHSGELLAMQRALITARARAEAAAARAARDEQLHAEGVIARNRVEESRAQRIESAAAEREQEQLLQLAGMPAAAVMRLRGAADLSPVLTITARRSGQVLEQLAGPGDAVTSGMPVLRLARLDMLWIELQATREQAARIREGDAVAIGGCVGRARVIAAAPQLGQASQTVAIRAELANPAGCVAPNQFVEAKLTPRTTAASLVQVPAASVVRHQGRDHVFVKTADGIEVREVAVERRTAAFAWVSGALQAGDPVATTGIAALKGAWQGFGAGEAP